MARDYANKKSPKKKPKTRISPGLVGVIVLLVIIVFVAGLGYVRNHHDTSKKPTSEAIAETPSKHNKTKKTKMAVLQPRKVQFDFYTILPNGKANDLPKKGTLTKTINVDVEPIHKPIEDAEQMTLSGRMEPIVAPVHHPAPTPAKAPAKEGAQNSASANDGKAELPKNSYILQIASFRKLEDANQLKDQMDLLSIDAKVSNIENKGTQWYRVWIGPFVLIQDAKKKQKELQESHVKSLIVRLK
jgi:cell division septation protein DedD